MTTEQRIKAIVDADETLDEMGDRELAAKFNERTFPGEVRVTVLSLTRLLVDEGGKSVAEARGIVGRLVASINTAKAHDPVLAEVHSLLAAGEGVDVGHDVTRAILSELTAVSLTADDVAAIESLANNKRSLADVHRLGEVTQGHIERMRRL